MVELVAASLQTDDVLCIVDVHDATQSPAGSTKKILLSSMYANPTFTGTIHAAAAAFSGNVTIAGTLGAGAISGNVTIAGTLGVTGAITGSASITGTDIFAGAGDAHRWVGRSMLASPSDGNITLFNNAQTGFTLLRFGGVTSGFPAIKRNAAQIDFRLADDSGPCSITGLNITGTNFIAATGGTIGFSARSTMQSPVDGNLQLGNSTASDFALLQFGGTTSSFPALKRSAAGLLARLADDSNYTFIRASSLLADNLNCSGFAGNAKVLGGTTGTTIRNNADSADNLLISDAGVVTSRSNLVVGSGLVQLGGTTSSFAAIKRSAAKVQARLADDSAFADVDTGAISATGSITTTTNLSVRSGNALIQNTGGTSVSTSFVQINTGTSQPGGLAIVSGTDGTNKFSDLVFWSNNTTNALASQAVTGAPAARSYANIVAGQLWAKVASGTYTVYCTELQQTVGS